MKIFSSDSELLIAENKQKNTITREMEFMARKCSLKPKVNNCSSNNIPLNTQNRRFSALTEQLLPSLPGCPSQSICTHVLPHFLHQPLLLHNLLKGLAGEEL